MHEAKIDAGGEEMGRPGLAQGMNAGQFVDAAPLEGVPEGCLKAALGQGLRGGGSLDSASPRSRKNQQGSARGDPGLAQEFQGPVWQWDVPVLPAFPVADRNESARTIAIGHARLRSLLQPHPAGVNGGETGAVREQPDGPEALSHRLDAQEDGEVFLPRWANKRQGRPCSCAGMLTDKLDPAPCTGGRTAGGLPDVLQVKEGLATFFLRDLRRGLVKVLRKLAHGPNVPLLSTCRQAPERKSLDHASAECCHGYTFWARGGWVRTGSIG